MGIKRWRDSEMELIEKQIIRVQQKLLRRMTKGNMLNAIGHAHEAVAALAEAASYVSLMTWSIREESNDGSL